MSRSMIAGAVTFFLLLLTLRAQTVAREAAVTGATATVTNLDISNNTATVEIADRSAKEIDAFVLAYSFVYSDGQTIKGELTEDWGPQKWADHNTLQPGNTHTETLHLDQREPAYVVAVNVEIVLVAYSDQTAEVRSGGDASLERLLAERSAQARSLQKSVEAITNALNSPDEAPAATALRVLTSLRDKMRVNHSQEVSVGYLDEAIKGLRAAPRGTGERAYLTRQLMELQTKATLSQKYSQLRRLP